MTSMKRAASDLAIHHELRKRLGGIECEIGVVAVRGVEETARPQSLGNARPVLRGSNDERRTIRQDGIGAKRRYRVEEKCVRLIEADDMLGCMHGDAVRTFRARSWNACFSISVAHRLSNLHPCRINLYAPGKGIG